MASMFLSTQKVKNSLLIKRGIKRVLREIKGEVIKFLKSAEGESASRQQAAGRN